MKKSRFQRIMAMFLAVLLLLGMIPTNVFAAGTAAYTAAVSFDSAMGSARAEFKDNVANEENTGIASSSWVLSAEAKENYKFSGWEQEGKIVSTDNPYEASISSDTNYTAVFEVIQQASASAMQVQPLAEPAPALTVRLNHGETESGDSLKAIVESVDGRLGINISFFEILSGTLTSTDATYLVQSVNGNINTNVSVIVDESVGGVDSLYGLNLSKNIVRFEIPGLTSLKLIRTFSNGDALNTIWIPGIETLGTGSGKVFDKAGIEALYLPNLKQIKLMAFNNATIKQLILPGDVPAVQSNSMTFVGASITVWVPADKADAYKNAADAVPDDGLWHGCQVMSLPDGVTDLKGLVGWAADQIPEIDKITTGDVDKVILARQFASALPYSLVTGEMAAVAEKISNAYKQLDKIPAQEVLNKIAALPAVSDITLDDSEIITDVWNSYQNLSNKSKTYIDEDNYQKLKAAYDKLKILELQPLINKINSLPDSKDITIDDKETVYGVWNEYWAISESDRGYINEDVFSRLQGAYDRIKTLEYKPVSDKIAALPQPEEVTLDDKQSIEEAWNQYWTINKEDRKYIEESVYNKLSGTYKTLNLLLVNLYIEQGVPYIALYNDIYLKSGNTVSSLNPAGIAETITSTKIFNGMFTSAELSKLYYGASLTVGEKVVIQDETIDPDFTTDSTKEYLKLSNIKKIQSRAFIQNYKSGTFTLEVPNVEYIGDEVYSDSSNYFNIPNYPALMPKLTQAYSILHSTRPLMLPRLQKAGRVYQSSTEKYIYLPSLEEAGPYLFVTAGTKSVWMPKVRDFGNGALMNAKIEELYLGSTPPSISGVDVFRTSTGNPPENRTVYVPDDAVSVYKASGDGEKWNGWIVKGISESPTAADFVNYLINNLSDNDELSADYAQWALSIQDLVDMLSAAQKLKVNTEGLTDILDKIGETESTDVQKVITQINGLTEPENIQLSDRLAVEDARRAYDGLTKISKDKITNLSRLQTAEEKLSVVIAQDISDKIDALDSKVTKENKDQVRSVYTDYLALNDKTKEKVENRNTLLAFLDKVIQIEKDILSANGIDGRISALPASETLTLNDKENVAKLRKDYDKLTADAKKLVQNLSILTAAETKIKELSQAENEKTIYISFEKFTLGRGYIQTPVPVVIKKGESIADIVVNLLGDGNYEADGTVEEGFYLSSVKDNDSEEPEIPQYIKDVINAAMGSMGERTKKDWLGEFDYYGMSGWMYTVNNSVPSLGANQYTYDQLNDGDVIRWQYTVYGHGADLGFDSPSGGKKLLATADKDALTRQIAVIDSSSEKLGWLENKEYAKVYKDALAIAENMLSTQKEVDEITAKLAKTPQIDSIGKVKVIVKDMVARRQYTNTAMSTPIAFKNLTGLGDYQTPLGVILEADNIPITADMTAIDVVVGLLESNGYIVQRDSKGITCIGPVTSEDKTRTVAQLGAGDVGNVSKWVLSLNNQAIYDSKTYEFHPEDGDTITLEYSVDGGYDVGCYYFGGVDFGLTYMPGAVLQDTQIKYPTTSSNSYIYFPNRTKEISYEYIHRAGYRTYSDQINRYNILNITVDGKKLSPNESIAISDGQVIQTSVTTPAGAGTGSIIYYGYSYTVRIAKTAEELEKMIDELPDPGSIKAGEEEYQYFYDYNAKSHETKQYYDAMSDRDKKKISDTAVNKLNETVTKVVAIGKTLYDSTREFYNALSKLPQAAQISKNSIESYRAQVESARLIIDSYTEYKKQFAIETSQYYYGNFLECEEKVKLIDSGGGETIGIPTDYYDDIIISDNAFNLDLGAAEDAYEVVFKDTPRVSNSAPIHLKGKLTFDIKDPSIFEIKEVDVTWTDTGLGGGNKVYDTVKYYLIPKKAGTTTFTVSYDEFGGQTPEMVVHVNNPDESNIEDLDDKLTNINQLPNTSKYDTWHYWEGTEGAKFTFKVNGSNPKVKVYNYLKYDESGDVTENTKTEYPVDENGNVTVFLKDGYNSIEVSSAYEGSEVTQVYGIKGKVIKYELTNKTDPDSGIFKEGDTVSLSITGLSTPIKKILRIYNPSATVFRFDTNMPRYTTLTSGGGQYSATTMEFVLTGSGSISLTNGRLFQDWFGSPLYSETAQGNQGESAPQLQGEFSIIPDIAIHVEENPEYNPDIVGVKLDNKTVKAGDMVTLTIPDLNIQHIADSHVTTESVTDDIYKAFTIYHTDIPGLETVQSKEVAGKTDLRALKTITFTVPEDTAPGKYRIFGGYVDVTHGISWWLKYTQYFEGDLDDCILTVVNEELENAKTAAISELENYVDADNYDNARKAALTEVIANGKTAINAAETVEAVNIALSEAKAAIDLIPTKDQEPQDFDSIYQTTRNFIRNNTPNPSIASIGGDWTVLGLARSGYTDQEYYDQYLSNVIAKVQEKAGVLHSAKYTEYSRVVLGLTAIGADVTDVGGYNLLEPLANYDKVIYQGVNGAAFALIAFDSHHYEIPTLKGEGTQTTRENLIQRMLDLQVTGGGWSLSGDGADTDMTAMVIQALAPYYGSNGQVKEAVDKALLKLSAMQGEDGAFGSEAEYGAMTSESTAQVIVALTRLGIDPVADARFIKNGKTALDALCSFYVSSGGFRHLMNGKLDGMATEQGYYALTAYDRFKNGQTDLYDMSDVTAASDKEKADRVIELINEIGTPVTLDSEGAINKAVIAYNALTGTQKSLVTNYETLQKAVEDLSKLKEELNNPGNGNNPGNTGGDSITGNTGNSDNNKGNSTGKKAGKSGKSGTSGNNAATAPEVTYEVSDTTKQVVNAIQKLLSADSVKALPEDFDKLTNEQINDILSTYRLYDALSADEKLFVDNYSSFEKVLDKLGDVFHQDKESGVDMRGNDKLPWNVKINITPKLVTDKELAKVRETLGKDGDMLALYDISFIDMLTGEEYHQDSLVTVKISLSGIDYDKYKTLVMVHIKDDGTYEYIEGKIKDGYFVFKASEFSKYAVAGSMGTWEEMIPAETASNYAWIWIGIVVIGLCAIAVVIAVKRRNSVKNKE